MLIDLILDEAKWIAAAVFLALCTAVLGSRKRRRVHGVRDDELAAAFSLLYGTMIGIMAFGHLLAVGVRAAHGTLEGSLPLLLLMGVALAIPSWGLVARERPTRAPERSARGRTWWNLGLAVVVVALGPHNLPLAAPGALNAILARPTSPWLRLATVTVLVLAHTGLLVGSIVFVASGQSFEDFRDID